MTQDATPLDPVTTRLFAPDLAAEAKHEAFLLARAKACRAIEDGTDGPLTSFVVIQRAVRMAAEGRYPADVCGEALAATLEAMFGLDHDVQGAS